MGSCPFFFLPLHLLLPYTRGFICGFRDPPIFQDILFLRVSNSGLLYSCTVNQNTANKPIEAQTNRGQCERIPAPKSLNRKNASTLFNRALPSRWCKKSRVNDWGKETPGLTKEGGCFPVEKSFKKLMAQVENRLGMFSFGSGASLPGTCALGNVGCVDMVGSVAHEPSVI